MEIFSAIGGLCGAIALLLAIFRINTLEKRIEKLEKDKNQT
ncbi:hypothetical protein [Helicobacter sp. 13S00477-4]|nr:hypothetical protein [Helicobacter sp. 13S00477-4]